MWTLVKAGGPEANAGQALKEYLVTSETDISTPPSDTSIAPGSIAYTADLSKIWMKSNSNTWTLLS